VEEALSGFRLRIPAGSFFQANPPLAAGIFQGIADHVAGSASIAELYAGVGALTLFLARTGRPLTAVEGNAASLRAARNNASWNGLEGIEWVSADVLEVMQGWSRRARGFHSVVLDPPRQGLPAGATELLAKLADRKIVYLSCDPSTLARDLRDLVRSDGWRLERVVPVDFFPQTAAIECVAYLGKG
jgi:23S rRNA (uracil1939-C5)-methyltransferase